jgi:hypothetical protein
MHDASVFWSVSQNPTCRAGYVDRFFVHESFAMRCSFMTWPRHGITHILRMVVYMALLGIGGDFNCLELLT